MSASTGTTFSASIYTTPAFWERLWRTAGQSWLQLHIPKMPSRWAARVSLCSISTANNTAREE